MVFLKMQWTKASPGTVLIPGPCPVIVMTAVVIGFIRIAGALA